MHKSRLAGFIIDCKTEDLEAAAAFWGGALGMDVRDLPGQTDKYIELEDPGRHLHMKCSRSRTPAEFTST